MSGINALGREGSIRTLTRKRPRMLVATELEGDAARTAETAAELAGGLGATNTLIRVVPPSPKPWVWMSHGLLLGSAAYIDSLITRTWGRNSAACLFPARS
jgi:hypothetical protein